ncbi:MAG: hypothetical protein R3B06_08980 [Kofleriaceae bacterium]
MKGVLIHGALLGVMLVYGYKTWSREASTKPTTGEVVMWNRTEAELTKLEYQTDERTVRIERRGQGADAYWWGTETKTIKKPKPIDPAAPVTPDPAKADPAKADPAKADPAKADPAKPGAAKADPATPDPTATEPTPPAEPPAPEFITETTTTEFPIGDEGVKVIKQFARMRAIQGVGVPNDDDKKSYGLTDAKTSIAVVFADGAKTLVVGGRVYSSSDRYLQDLDTGKTFVVLGTTVATLEGGEASLRPTDLRGFDAKQAVAAEIAAGAQRKQVARIKVKAPSEPEPNPHAPPPDADAMIETWGQGQTADTTVANFLDKLEKLRPGSYDPKLDVAALETVVAATYRDARGKDLGTIKLLRRVTKAPPVVDPAPGTPPATPGTPPGTPGTPPPAPGTPPPAPAPAADKVEYFLWTPVTRVPGVLSELAAARVEQDVPTLFAK